ncbi:MAG: BTAD domain-containing putative transcriptional regulator [Gemmatimonas sp.]
MIELRLLGPHAVRDSNGQEVGSLSASPKRFALLAYLAVRGTNGFHRRDTLAAMFWPEMDQFSARRALRNTLYHLREALGDGVIVTQGDDGVALDAERITTDVAKLNAAVAGGRFEEAADRYQGELLAGIHIANADAAFEDWLSRERKHVVEITLRAVRALVDRETAVQNFTGAAYWAQRAITLAPDDATWVRRGMALLADGNDRGGALRLYESYARRLAAEFEIAPDAQTEKLAQQIRSGQRDAIPVVPESTEKQPIDVVSASITKHTTNVVPESTAKESLNVVPSVASASAKLETERLELPVEDSPALEMPALPPHAIVNASRSRFVNRGVLWTAALALSFAAFAMFGWMRIRNTAHEGPRPRVLIAVFENRTGEEHFQSLGRMAEDWLTRGTLRTQVVDVVDPRVMFVQSKADDAIAIARRTGATLVISGSYYRARDSLLFEAAVIEVSTGRVLNAIGPVATPVGTPMAALDALQSRVMTALQLATHVGLPRVAETRTGEIPPFEAYQSYLDGWDAFWHGDGKRSMQAFLDAAHRDTLFGGAAVAAATAASNYNDCALIDSIDHVFASKSRTLDRIDRLSLQIDVMHCRGQNEEMLRLTLERADLEPQTSSLRLSAAAAALWANRPGKTVEILTRINPDVDLGWSTDSTHFSYFSSLTEALHLLGRYDDELATATDMSTSAPLARAWLRGRALAALPRSSDLLALVDSTLTLPAETAMNIGLAPYSDGRPQYASTAGWVAAWIARELAVHGDSVTSRLVAARAVAWYRGRSPEERATAEERLVAAWSYDLSGDDITASRLLQELVSADTANADYRGFLAEVTARLRVTTRADSLDAWLGAQTAAQAGWAASSYRAATAAIAGRTGDAFAYVRETIDRGAWPMWLHNDPALARLRARPDFAALLAPKG